MLVKSCQTYTNTLDNVIFDLGKGLYNFEQISKFNKFIAFSGKRSTTVVKMTQQMDPKVFQNPELVIQPKHIFPAFPWKEYISKSLESFGRYCSIAVGLWTIIAIFKSLCIWLNGLFLVKKLTNSHKQTAKYALSPSYFLLKTFNNIETHKQQTNPGEKFPF